MHVQGVVKARLKITNIFKLGAEQSIRFLNMHVMPGDDCSPKFLQARARARAEK